jgi:hypothetical protein
MFNSFARCGYWLVLHCATLREPERPKSDPSFGSANVQITYRGWVKTSSSLLRVAPSATISQVNARQISAAAVVRRRSAKPTAIQGRSFPLSGERSAMIWSNVITPKAEPPSPPAKVASDSAFVVANLRPVGFAAYKALATTGARQSSKGMRAGHPISFQTPTTRSSRTLGHRLLPESSCHHGHFHSDGKAACNQAIRFPNGFIRFSSTVFGN